MGLLTYQMCYIGFSESAGTSSNVSEVDEIKMNSYAEDSVYMSN